LFKNKGYINNFMSEAADTAKKNANYISFGTITFLIGILVASLTMYTFMEGRIAKEVQESMRLAQLEQQVKSDKQAASERHKAIKDQIWVSDQNVKSQMLDFSNRIGTLEARVSSFPQGQMGSPILKSFNVKETTDK